jgi:hypothetical protein
MFSWVPVAHSYNPSYSGGRNQEDSGSKPAWANSSQDPISKTLGRVAQGEGPKVKPQYHKKKVQICDHIWIYWNKPHMVMTIKYTAGCQFANT